MKVTSYFIKHPVVSIIINCLIIVVGALCFHNLSLREYPVISFPTITVKANYPNASPFLVETAVTNILEDRLAGIEGLETISSQSSEGSSEISLLFRTGTPMDRALNATQDAVGMAKALLPKEVGSPTVERQSKANGLPFIGLSIESKSLDFGELTHFANLHLKQEFRSLPGVASVNIWGQPYTYEISLFPKKLFSFGVNVDEVLTAIEKSSASLPVGNFQKKIPSTLNYELKSIKDYENLLIKPHHLHPILLKSIGDVKLVTDTSKIRMRVNGHTGLILSINRANDANPIDVSKLVRDELNALKNSLPKDIKANIIIDQSNFINASLKNIRSGIIEAIMLVLVIVFIFLRNIRATIIPLITIPISLLGSLIFLKIFGFSINLMTLLAMVLAIGLVVDDAIIVLENIWRHIEQGLSPREAAILGAKEIGFAIVAMTCTLASVYMPIAFIQGMMGQLFIEFAVALAGSVFISGVVALTLSPLMCEKLLSTSSSHWWPQVDIFLEKLSQHYSKSLAWVLHRKKFPLICALSSLCLCLLFYNLLPHETAPKEDRGLVGVYIPPISGESMDSFDKTISQIEHTTDDITEAQNKLTFIGDWGANIVLPLKSQSKRHRNSEKIVDELKPKLSHFPSVDPIAWSWDSGLPGVDNAGSGTELSLVVSSTDSYQNLFKQTAKLKSLLDKSKLFQSTRYDLRLDTMGYSISIDSNNLAKLGLTANEIAKTIEVFFSGDRSITFQKDSVVYNLTIKGAKSPWTLDELYLTSASGKRISLGAITTMKPKAQPSTLEHYKQMRSTTLHVELLPGDNLPNSMKKLTKLTNTELPLHYKLTWTGAAKAYSESSNDMFFLLILALIFIYAILAIQFENFIDPLVILFTVPLGCAGALFSAWLFGQSLNIYSQVGLITLIGLISKHGILIVEFANQLLAEGYILRDALLQSCVLRLRPILMTTGAMIFGAIPLVLSHDAGSESRQAIGIVLIGGLAMGTVFTLFVLPGIYYFIKSRWPGPNDARVAKR